MPPRKTGNSIDDAYKEFLERQAEMNELLHGVRLPDNELHRLGLLEPRPLTKADVKEAIKREAFRRQHANEPVNAGILHRWAAEKFPPAVVPTTKRPIQTWLYKAWGFRREK